MIEFEKINTSIAKNSYNFNAHGIVELSLILQSTHGMPRD